MPWLPPQHPTFSRRTLLQAGAVGLLGLGSGHLTALRSMAAPSDPVRRGKARAVIYIFLSGGLAQHDSFDLKPDAPDTIRGEFKPIATRTPGIRICEHLPCLAARSDRWALVRSLTHRTNNHSDGHLLMLTGRSDLPPGFSPNKPQPTDWPSLAAVAGAVTGARNNLPPAVILPDRLIHNSGRVIPGPYAGIMGHGRDPWVIEASPFNPRAYGAFPEYEFDHQQRPIPSPRQKFVIPDLSLPQGVSNERFTSRLSLLHHLDQQRRDLDAGDHDRYQGAAVSLLTHAKVREAFDVHRADPKLLDRYGRNSFGYSLLMARQLVEAGVNLVQVNLGNNETWDTHGNAFYHLREKLFPPTDRALSALLDDLHDRGLLDSTLLVMAGEFGRTPRISTVAGAYKLPGRDHWGAVQTVFFAGGGVQGGRVVGSSDKNGAFPASNPQTPEALGATIYQALGIPSSTQWYDTEGRPHAVYLGEPIPGLMGERG
jgi:uncharacterized protein (DUF1501 family)